MFFCYDMYTDTKAQRQVQKITGEHTTDNSDSEEQLERNSII